MINGDCPNGLQIYSDTYLMLSALAFFAEPAYPHNKNSNTYINKDFIKK